MSSVPGAPLVGALTTVEAFNPIEQLIGALNTNPVFIGLMMLVLNLGGRFLVMEVSKEQEKFFSNPWVRASLFFVVIFIATRNILVAFWLSIVVILLIKFVFNENSALYILKREGGATQQEGMVAASPLTPEEMDIFKKMSDKMSRSQQQQTEEEKEEAQAAEMTYLANMSRLRL